MYTVSYTNALELCTSQIDDLLLIHSLRSIKNRVMKEKKERWRKGQQTQGCDKEREKKDGGERGESSFYVSQCNSIIIYCNSPGYEPSLARHHSRPNSSQGSTEPKLSIRI